MLFPLLIILTEYTISTTNISNKLRNKTLTSKSFFLSAISIINFLFRQNEIVSHRCHISNMIDILLNDLQSELLISNKL